MLPNTHKSNDFISLNPPTPLVACTWSVQDEVLLLGLLGSHFVPAELPIPDSFRGLKSLD
jgi:hypothetical protein